MALKVSESAKIAYYTVIPKELEAFWALQGALGPRGGQIGPPDGAHMQVKWPSGPSDFVFFFFQTQNLTAPAAISPTYERLRVVRFAPRGVQGRPGGPLKLQIPSRQKPNHRILR